MAEIVDQLINLAVDQAEKEMLGKRVMVTTGKYKGRFGFIKAVSPHTEVGMTYLVMVQRSDRSGPLNSDTQSRSYRPRTDFKMAPPVTRKKR